MTDSAPPDTAARGRVRPETHLFLGVCVAAVVAFFVWASVGTLDVVASAFGEVVPSSQVKTVQHLEGGIVKDIKVRTGERVEQGQELIVLEPVRIGSEIEEVRVRLAALYVAMKRLEAEVAGADGFDVDTEAGGDLEIETELVEQAEALFAARRDRLEKQIAVQRQAIAQREQEVREVANRLANNRSMLKLVEQQVEISENLLKRELTNRMTHLGLEREEMSLRGQIGTDSALLPRAQAAMEEAKAQVDAIRSTFLEEARTELDQTRRLFKEQSQKLLQLRDSLRRTVLRAPVDGIVKTLNVVTRGGVVQPGAPVIELVPVDDRLIIEARLATHDIGFVRIGQAAALTLTSADAQRFGALDGTVTSISPDTLVTEDGQPFYKVRVETDRAYFEKGKLRYDLYPGMQLQANILTGSRTVLEYLLDPYIASMRMAMSER
jgi:adhesin transport system membrane fusion protein